jgi:hypothetical protein
MNSTENPHSYADSSVSSVCRESPVFRISKLLLNKFITGSRERHAIRLHTLGHFDPYTLTARALGYRLSCNTSYQAVSLEPLLVFLSGGQKGRNHYAHPLSI